MRELIEKLIESILRKLTNVTWQRIEDEPGSKATTSFYKIQHVLGGDPKVLEENILNPMRAQFKEAFSKQYPEFKFTDEVFNQVMTMAKSTSEQEGYRIKVDPAALELAVTNYFKLKYGKKQSGVSNAGVESKSVKPVVKEVKADVVQSLDRKDGDTGVKKDLKKDNGVVELKAKEKLLKVRVIFLLDKTASMTDVINTAIEQLCQVTGLFNEKYPKADVQFGLVAFSDFPNPKIIEVYDFAPSDITTTNLRSIQVEGNYDIAEFVNGALQEANLLADKARSEKQEDEEMLLTAFLLTDSVPHGFQRQLKHAAIPFTHHPFDNHPDMLWEDDLEQLSNKGCPLNVLTCIRYPEYEVSKEIHEFIAAQTGGVRFDFGNMNAFRTIVGAQLEADATVSLAIGDAISEKVQALTLRKDLTEDELVREAMNCASSSGEVIAAMSSSGEVTMEKLENAVRRQLIRSNVGSSAGPISGRSSSGPGINLSQPGMVSSDNNSQPGLDLPALLRPLPLLPAQVTLQPVSGVNGVTVTQAVNGSVNNNVSPQALAVNASPGPVRGSQPGLDSGLARYKPLSINRGGPAQSQPGMPGLQDLSQISRGLRNLKDKVIVVPLGSNGGPNNGSGEGPAKPADPKAPAKKS